jgi:hypothetical protein
VQTFYTRGQFDPRSLTAGARGHAGRPRWTRSNLVSGLASATLARRPGRRPAHRRRRRGTRGRGRTQTRSGALRWFGRAAAETKWSPGRDAGDRRSSCKRQCSAGWLAGAETEGEKGPRGPEPHQEHAGDVGLAGEGLPAANSAAASADTCREGELGGGDCDRPGSLHLKRR